MEYLQQNQQAMAGLRAPIFEDKVVDFILEMAEVSDRAVSPEELMADPDQQTEEKKEASPKKNKDAPKKKRASKKKADTAEVGEEAESDDC